MGTKLLSRYVYFPKGTRLREVVDESEACWGPQENPSDFWISFNHNASSCGHPWVVFRHPTSDGLVKYMMPEFFSDSAVYCK